MSDSGDPEQDMAREREQRDEYYRQDPYEGKVRLGRIVLNAARAAVHDDSEPDLARVNAILTGEAFVNALADAGCMVTRIPAGTAVSGEAEAGK